MVYYRSLYLLCTAAQVTHSESGVAWTGLLCWGWQHKLCACAVGWLIEPLHLSPHWSSSLNSLRTEVRAHTEKCVLVDVQLHAFCNCVCFTFVCVSQECGVPSSLVR